MSQYQYVITDELFFDDLFASLNCLDNWWLYHHVVFKQLLDSKNFLGDWNTTADPMPELLNTFWEENFTVIE